MIQPATTRTRKKEEGKGGKARHQTIGQVARAAGVATTALRYYEREGILKPSSRTAKGYRLYDEGDVRQLAFIRAAQAVGFTLDDIRTLLAIDETTSCKQVRSMIEARVAEIDAKLANLRRVRTTLIAALEQCRKSNKSCPVIAELKNSRRKGNPR